jgi:hypothetical protein
LGEVDIGSSTSNQLICIDNRILISSWAFFFIFKSYYIRKWVFVIKQEKRSQIEMQIFAPPNDIDMGINKSGTLGWFQKFKLIQYICGIMPPIKSYNQKRKILGTNKMFLKPVFGQCFFRCVLAQRKIIFVFLITHIDLCWDKKFESYLMNFSLFWVQKTHVRIRRLEKRKRPFLLWSWNSFNNTNSVVTETIKRKSINF